MFNLNWHNKKRILLGFVWILAIAIRLYGATTKGQFYDMGTFSAWSSAFWVFGPQNFFSSVWSDYLPLPILTFAPISVLSTLLSLPFELVFKLAHILLELVLLFFIFRFNRTLPPVIPPFLLLSPALIGDTAFWGQVDTIPSLLSLLSLVLLLKPHTKSKHRFLSPLLYGLAVAYKPIMILIAPVMYLVSLKRYRSLFYFPLIASLVFFASALPFVHNPLDTFSFLLTRILNQAGTYPYLTINAFNLYALTPVYSWVLDSVSVFTLSAQVLGYLIFFVASFFTFRTWHRTGYNLKYSYRIAATILIAFFAFTTRMHERHLLFGLPFLALAIAHQRFLLLPYLGLTLAFVLNLYGAFAWVHHDQTWPFSLSTISLLSWVTVSLSAFITIVWRWPKFNNKALIIVLAVSTILRLANLAHPPVYIFDEVYHAYTATQYLHNNLESWQWWTSPPPGVAYEWTHPPLAKYGMVLGMLIFGENSLGWRIGSVVMGVLSILGIYRLTYALFKKRTLALLAAFLISIEALHISQSRIAMNDIYLLCFYIWSLYLATQSRFKGSAILFGLALASKWSAVYGILPLALIYLHQNKLSLSSALSSLRLVLIALSIYLLTFAPFILLGHTWAQWWELHRQMWYYHTNLVATHAYQSAPWQWIFTIRPVWYWVEYQGATRANIYALANPAILWLGMVALFLQIKKIFIYPTSLLYLLYAVFTIPWIFSPRIMFFYHYLPSATFLCIILATWLAGLSPRSRYRILIFFSVILLLISPFIYGFNTPNLYWDTVFTLLPSWK